MELIEQNVPVLPTMAGHQTVSVSAGKTLKIETTPDGEEILNTTVPEGKVWEIRITVNVKETSA